MLVFKRFLPYFGFSWWGEARLVKESHLPQSQRSPEFDHQVRVLSTKVSHAQIIVDLCLKGKVIYQWPQGQSSNTMQSQQGQQVSSEQPVSRCLSLGQFIMNTLKKAKEHQNEDQREATDELIGMFEPGKGHKMNPIVYNRQHFTREKLSSDSSRSDYFLYVFDPDPLLMSQFRHKMPGGNNHILTGPQGIGKSVASALLTELYKTISLYNWLKAQGNNSMDFHLQRHTRKIIYILLTSSDNEKSIVQKLKAQFSETNLEIFDNSQQLNQALSQIENLFHNRKIDISFIIDEIDTYYYDTASSLKDIVKEFAEELSLKQVTDRVNEGRLLLDEKLPPNELKQESIKRYSSARISQNYETQYKLRRSPLVRKLFPDHQFCSLSQDEIVKGVLMKTLYYQSWNTLCISSRTISDEVFKFCAKNLYFNIIYHTQPGMVNYKSHRNLLTREGQFVVNKRLIFELKRVLSSSALFVDQYEEEVIMEYLEKQQWPHWVKLTTLRKESIWLEYSQKFKECLFKSKDDQIESSAGAELDRKAQKNSMAALMMQIKQKVIEESYTDILERLKLFLGRSKPQQQFYQLYLLLSLADYIQQQVQGGTQIKSSSSKKSPFTVELQELNILEPYFVMTPEYDRVRHMLSQQYMWRQYKQIRHYFQMLQKFQLFDQETCRSIGSEQDSLSFDCDYDHFIRLSQSIRSSEFAATIFSNNVDMRELQHLFATAIRPQITAEGSSLQIVARPYGPGHKQEFSISHDKQIVYFQDYYTTEDADQSPQTIGNFEQVIVRQNKQPASSLSVQFTVFPVFKSATESPRRQLLALPFDRRQYDPYDDFKLLPNRNGVFDLITVTYNPEEERIEASILKWSLQVGTEDSQGINMWWSGLVDKLQNLLHKHTSFRGKVEINRMVACPSVVFTHQSKKHQQLKDKIKQLGSTTVTTVFADIERIRIIKDHKEQHFHPQKLFTFLRLYSSVLKTRLHQSQPSPLQDTQEASKQIESLHYSSEQ